MTAFSYLRVSGKGQIEGDGFPRQREKIAKWAKASRTTIAAEFTEEGVCGATDLDGRPAMLALLAALVTNGVRAVVIERADRLARDVIVSELLLRQFQEMGVRVIEAESGTDLTAGDSGNPTAKLIRQILAAVAEFDKCSLVLKMRLAREKIRRQHGRCEGVKPFGTFDGEAGAIERMRVLRRKPKGGQRMSFAKIAEALTKEGFPTRQGGAWKPETVRQILGRQ